MGKPDEAMASAEEAFALYLAHQDIAGKALAYGQLGDVYFDCGKYEAVRGLCQESLERLKLAPVQDYELSGLLGLAREELRQRNFDDFDDVLRRAHHIAEDVRDHISLISIENMAGQAAVVGGEISSALKHFETALRLALPNGGGTPVLESVRSLASALLSLGNAEGAQRLLGMEAGWRETLGCGLTVHEQNEHAPLAEKVGEDLVPIQVDSSKQLAAKSLAILKSTPLAAPV